MSISPRSNNDLTYYPKPTFYSHTHTQQPGVRKRRRRKTCRRCLKKVCDSCSTRKRWDFVHHRYERCCDLCLSKERRIKINHRISNLSLRQKRNTGVFVAKSDSPLIVDGARVIELNGINVEAHTANRVANRLNVIKVPFRITLDYTDCDLSSEQLDHLMSRRRSSSSTLSRGPRIDLDSSFASAKVVHLQSVSRSESDSLEHPARKRRARSMDGDDREHPPKHHVLNSGVHEFHESDHHDDRHDVLSDDHSDLSDDDKSGGSSFGPPKCRSLVTTLRATIRIDSFALRSMIGISSLLCSFGTDTLCGRTS